MRNLVRCEPREERGSRGLDDRTKSDRRGGDDVIRDATVRSGQRQGAYMREA